MVDNYSKITCNFNFVKNLTSSDDIINCRSLCSLHAVCFRITSISFTVSKQTTNMKSSFLLHIKKTKKLPDIKISLLNK